MHPRSADAPWLLLRGPVDLLLAAASFWFAFALRMAVAIPGTHGILPPERWHTFQNTLLPALVSELLALYLVGLYDTTRPQPRFELARRLVLAVLLQGVALIAWFFVFERLFPRSVLLLFVLAEASLLWLWRAALQGLHRPRRREVVILGSGAPARELALAIDRHHWHGLRVRAHLPTPGEEEPPAGAPGLAELGPRLASLAELEEMLERGDVPAGGLPAPPFAGPRPGIQRRAGGGPPHASLLLLPGPFESRIGRMQYRWVNDLPLIEIVRDSGASFRRPLKRALDLVLGGALSLVALPVLAGCALAVRLTSSGPVFYRQVRVGRGLRPFTLHKLRTMRDDAEQGTGEVLAAVDDPGLRPIGGVLRRLGLDVLPQLANVLAGEMSLVGPRPERPRFVERFLAEVPGYAERFTVSPGLTGLAQVNGDYHSSAANKLRYDLAYIANWNLWLDLSILLRTVKIVLTSRGV